MIWDSWKAKARKLELDRDQQTSLQVKKRKSAGPEESQQSHKRTQRQPSEPVEPLPFKIRDRTSASQAASRAATSNENTRPLAPPLSSWVIELDTSNDTSVSLEDEFSFISGPPAKPKFKAPEPVVESKQQKSTTTAGAAQNAVLQQLGIFGSGTGKALATGPKHRKRVRG